RGSARGPRPGDPFRCLVRGGFGGRAHLGLSPGGRRPDRARHQPEGASVGRLGAGRRRRVAVGGPGSARRPQPGRPRPSALSRMAQPTIPLRPTEVTGLDRKSTRLNSSHVKISYAVFCLKKKKKDYKSSRKKI